MDYQYVGKDTAINNSPAKACGSLLYAGDMHLPNMLHMKLILSPIAHGMVKRIDASAALALPGVVTVLSFENTPGTLYNRGRVRANETAPDQESLFTDHVRFVGDRVAAVVAQTPEIARQAAALVHLEIEPLPAVFTPEEALSHPEIKLHEKDSVITIPKIGYGDYDSAEGEEFHHRTVSQRLSHIAMENHCAVADYDPAQDRMTVWTATQSVFGARSAICTLLGMQMSHVRVIKAPMGGSFGSKQEMILEPLVACAAKMTGRPVKLWLSRHEVMLCTVLKHPIESEISVKFSPERKINAIRLAATLDAGGYQTVSPDYAVSISKKLSWVYDIPNIEYYPRTVCTNTPISGSYRGWGGPEANLIMENMMNAAAKHFGFDPVEFRLNNILPPYATSRIGDFSLGNLPLSDVLHAGTEQFHWSERRQRTAAQDRNARYLHGVGMSLTTHTSGYFPRRLDWGTLVIKMEEDGSVCINCNVHDHGCGEVTAFQAIAAEILKIPPQQIDIPEGDTAYNALDNGCYTSRSIYVLGRAVEDAAKKLLDELYRYASEILSCPISGLQHDGGCIYPVSAPENHCTYSQIAYYAADKGKGALFIEHTYIPHSNPGPAAAHFAEVEVDTLTGQCRVVDYTAVHDIGKAINPAACRGQIGSALQQGIGIVFCEQLEMQRDGRAKNADLQRYHIARAADLPHIETIFLEKADEDGPFGAKSVGESCYVPVAPALIAAVNDALETDFSELPLNPAKLLAALSSRRTHLVKKED